MLFFLQNFQTTCRKYNYGKWLRVSYLLQVKFSNWIQVGASSKVKGKNFNFLQNFNAFSYIIQDNLRTTQLLLSIFLLEIIHHVQYITL